MAQEERMENSKEDGWYMNRDLMTPGRELNIHGLRLSFRRKFPLIVRVLWLVLFIASCIVLICMIINQIVQYLSIPKRVIRERKHEPLTFPSVSICNQNPYKQSGMPFAPELLAVESYFAQISQGQLSDVVEIELEKHPHEGIKRCDLIPPEQITNGYASYQNARRLQDSILTIYCHTTNNQPKGASKEVHCLESTDGEMGWNGGKPYDLCIAKKCDPIEEPDVWNKKKIEYQSDAYAIRADGTSASLTCNGLHGWIDGPAESIRTANCKMGTWNHVFTCQRQCHILTMTIDSLTNKTTTTLFKNLDWLCTNTEQNTTSLPIQSPTKIKPIQGTDTSTVIMDVGIRCQQEKGIWQAAKPTTDIWEKAYNKFQDPLKTEEYEDPGVGWIVERTTTTKSIAYPCMGVQAAHATTAFLKGVSPITLEKMNAAPVNTPTETGQTANIQCETNWVLKDNLQVSSMSLYCLFRTKDQSQLELLWAREGETDSKPPECTRVCKPISGVEHLNAAGTIYKINSKTSGDPITDLTKITIGATVAVQCEENYVRIPTAEPVCEESGTWTYIPQCLKYCKEVTVEHAQSIPTKIYDVDELVVGSTYEITCDRSEKMNYTFVGNKRLLQQTKTDESHELLTCMENGEYDLEIPECMPQCKIIDLANGTIKYEHERRQAGTRAKLNCTEENTMLIGDYQVTCQENGRWNFWMDKDPYCQTIAVKLYDMLQSLDMSEVAHDSQALYSKEEEIRSYIIPTIDPKILTKFGHGLEMIKRCTFNKQICDMSDFERFYDIHLGNCHQYTPWDEYRNIRTSTRVGPTFGLNLHVNANETQYTRRTERTGVHIIIHKHNETVSSDASGLSVPMGLHTSLSLRYIEIKRINDPYGKCVEIGDPPNTFYYKKEYSVEGCYNSCRQRFVMLNCKCGEPALPFPPNDNRTCTLEERECVEELNELLTSEYLSRMCACVPPCRETEFKQTAHYALWPAKKALERFCQLESKSDKEKKDCMETFRRTNALVDVYYNLLEKEIYSEEISYPFGSLISGIGSQMSIWLGLSVLSLIELFLLAPRYWQVLREKRQVAEKEAEKYEKNERDDNIDDNEEKDK